MSSRSGVTAALLVLGILTGSAAAAQSPDQRAALDAWRDSLTAITDTTLLLALERAGIEVARNDRDNPVHHLRLGFLAYRLGELGGSAHYEDAAGEFEWAADLAPSWPYVWLGLGLSERAKARPTGNLLFGVMAWLGRDRRTLAADNFAKAVSADPGFFPALEALHETSTGQTLNQRLEITLGAFRRAAGTVATDEVRYFLYRGQLERQVGDADSARAAFREYLARGGNRGLGLIELARTQFLTESGADPYYEGAAIEDSASVAEYRLDLEPVADSVDLAAFDASRGSGRVTFLRDFWTSRDDADLRTRGERLAEHYRRLGYARTHFPAPPFLRRLQFGDYYANESDFDDRGVIYVRHGEPSVRRHIVNPTAEAYGAEIWRYDRAGDPMVFYFVADAGQGINGDPSDYRLKATPLDLPLRGDEDLQAIVPGLITANVARSRYAQELFIRGKRDIAVGTTTDSYDLRFDEPIEGRAQVAAAGARREGSYFHVAYAVPRKGLEVDASGAVPLAVRVVVFDTAGAVVARVDSSGRWVARDTAGVENLLGRVSVPVPAGRLTYRIAILNGARGGMFPPDSVTVPDGAAAALTLGEPILGSRHPGLRWVSPTQPDTVFFNPLLSFPRGGDLEIYYELRGLAPGAEYATELEVKSEGGGLLRKLFGGGKRIQLGFSETAARPLSRINRTIQLGDLDEGRYSLIISVTGPDGHTVKRERHFRVRR